MCSMLHDVGIDLIIQHHVENGQDYKKDFKTVSFEMAEKIHLKDKDSLFREE